MPRVIAIDFGLKRTGLAVTDPLRIIATALETIDSTRLMDHLKAYVAREAVDGFIVGMPTNLDGSPTDITANVQALVQALRANFPEKFVEAVDERFTSRMAQQTVMLSGKGRMARRDKGQLDRISATILLQDWLRRHG